MKVFSFKSLCLSCAVTLGLAISVEVTNADTIYIGTGTPIYSGTNGTTKNVSGTVTDSGTANGLADGYAGSSLSSSDPTNTRDLRWHATATDVFTSEYKKYFAGDKSLVNARRSAVEESLKAYGSTAHEYQHASTYGPHLSGTYYGSTGVAATGTIYTTTADLIGNVGMNQGGLSNFAVGSSGVITTHLGGYFDEAGQYTYNPDGSIVYNGNHSDSHTTGFTPVQSGIVAFTTSFTKDASTAAFQYINGTFAVLGELLGIYVNGNLLNASQYTLGEDMITSGYAYASQHEFEIDLDSIASMLVDGNNNLSFMIMGIPLNYTGVGSYTYNDSMSFIHLSADISQNTASIFGNNGGDDDNSETPEPATLLIFGIGLAGLGIRRKLMNKKSA